MNITTSFVQENNHKTKSRHFVTIQPSMIGQVLTEHGFDLVHLNTGKGRKAENLDHQTTIARYRSKDVGPNLANTMDIVFKVPHLYGSLDAYLAIFRQVCSNGLVVSKRFYSADKIRHSKNALELLNKLIPSLVAKQAELIETIKDMSMRDVTPSQVVDFVKEIAQSRLGNNNNIININYQDLMKVRRIDDNKPDAYTVMNVVQENIMNYGLRYDIETQDKLGRNIIQHRTARPILGKNGESARSVDLNASIWDSATKILMGR